MGVPFLKLMGYQQEHFLQFYFRVYTYIYIYIYKALLPCIMIRVGQNYIYTVYTRYFWQGNHQIYGHIRCIHTVLANPNHDLSLSANLRSVLLPFPFLVCFRAVL